MTEYEKELSKRVSKVGDKFIFRGGVYVVEQGEGVSCTGCNFRDGDLCNLLPDCVKIGVNECHRIYVKVEMG
ncbi:MAG: hypothetical protein GY928_16915 [Colwellia sp.]|nr:hypothetical protein [Colwellia sp.]